VDSTDTDSEPDNLRCWIKGSLPEPGYSYAGSAFRWPTIPDVLERAGIEWRIYQDPNDNWTGAMHGCLAFESFRTARPDSPLYRKGMSHWSLERLAQDVRNGTLPQVSWVLPSELWSEHPRPSSPLQGAEFTARVLSALTSNPEVWSRTVFLLTFDENDGLFDHAPAPAPPSYNLDGTLAGKSTLNLRGEYFVDREGRYIHRDDKVNGRVRPWGLGPRVPMYVISPWSKGGWVNSQVFDHTSVGQFLEKRFGVRIPAISPWHRAVCGDLTSAFDFAHPNDPAFPALPSVKGSSAVVAEHSKRPSPNPPAAPEKLFQEPGVRPSRALPYELNVAAHADPSAGTLSLRFSNMGRAGAVFHVYDRRHLDRIPRRYTVEAGKQLDDVWDVFQADGGAYDLWVYGPNDFVREFKGKLSRAAKGALPEATVHYDRVTGVIQLRALNAGGALCRLTVRPNAYRSDGPWTLSLKPGQSAERSWSLIESGNWYDFTVSGESFERRYAGRIETGAHGTSDPARTT
jgi:phospholipase C